MKIVISLIKKYSIKKTHLMMSFFYGARELPTLELVHETIINLKKVLNQDFVTDLKYFDVA